MSRQHALDLARSHTSFVRGDITIFLTWFGTAELTPAMVLVPTYRTHYEKATPCVIPIGAAWAWAEETGDPRHAARTSAQFCDHLGIKPNPNNCFRLTALVRDHLEDLLRMPPAPRDDVVAVADAIRTDEHGKEHHSVIHDRV